MSTIRISRDKMIAALNKAVADREAAIKQAETAERIYEKEYEVFKKNLLAAAKNGKAAVEYISQPSHYVMTGASFTIRYTLPEGMTEPTHPVYPFPMVSEDEIATIKQNIRLLEMSDDQYIPAGLYKSLSKFI